MRIGILTFHRSYNYGAFMQCFSLSQKLKKDFPQHKVEVIDFTNRSAMEGYANAINQIKNPEIKEKIKIRNNAFLKPQEELPLSEMKIVSNDYSEAIEYMNNNYDAVVVGSDAVWNWVVRGFPNLYFLKEYRGHKYSYAASAHGLKYQDMSDEQKKYLKEAFSEFEYIGVRDLTTENMVKFANPESQVFHNCDPTAFLEVESIPCDIEKLKSKLIDKGVDFSKPLIGIMATNAIGKQIKRKFKNRVQLIAVYEPNKYADIFLNDLTPYEWARVFSFFTATVTHFFHGTMLSLVNGVPVIPVEFVNNFSAVNKTKIEDVMTRLDLLEWRFSANYLNNTFIKKVLKRLGLWEDKRLWNGVNKLLDDMLNNDYKDIILEKIRNEAQNYNSFRSALNKIDGDIKND